VVQDVPIDQITEKTVLVYETIGSEIVGLTVIVLAVIFMVVGSLVFPDRDKSS